MNINIIKDKFLELEEIDKQINSINKYAFLIKDKELTIDLSMSHPKEKEVKIDSEGDIHSFKPIFFNFMSSKDNDDEIIKLQINEIISLEVLGVVSAHLESKKMYIINFLEKSCFVKLR